MSKIEEDKSEVLAMVRQSGCPSFFLKNLLCRLYWNDLVKVTLKFRNLKRAAEEIASVDYFTRCKFINHKPVTAIKYFQYRVKIFLRAVILISGPPSNGKYYAIRVDLQFCGSPHVHSFRWVVNAPGIDKDPRFVCSKS